MKCITCRFKCFFAELANISSLLVDFVNKFVDVHIGRSGSFSPVCMLYPMRSDSLPVTSTQQITAFICWEELQNNKAITLMTGDIR